MLRKKVKPDQKNIPVPSGEEIITYKGKILEIVHQIMQIGTKQIVFERARRSPGTRLLITSPDKKILLTKEHRVEAGGWDFRLPGGKVFDSLEEYKEAIKKGGNMLKKAQIAAKKEALEEAGVKVKNINHLSISKCGASVEWDLYYFEVKLETENLGKQKLEAGENIQVGWYSESEALKLALNRSISEDRSAAILMRYILNQNNWLKTH